MHTIRLLSGVILLSAMVAAPALSARDQRRPATSVTPKAAATPQLSASPSSTPVPSPSAVPQPLATFPIPTDRDSIVKLAILLDDHSFAPGEIDEHWSQLSKNALHEYQSANGQPASGQIDEQLHREFEQLTPYTTYQIKEEDLEWVGKSPLQPAAQARLKKMLYPSLADLVAERFHSKKNFLRSLNLGRSLDKAASG
jgi:hypothetical protein